MFALEMKRSETVIIKLFGRSVIYGIRERL
jgi:hypothetical protein